MGLRKDTQALLIVLKMQLMNVAQTHVSTPAKTDLVVMFAAVTNAILKLARHDVN